MNATGYKWPSSLGRDSTAPSPWMLVSVSSVKRLVKRLVRQHWCLDQLASLGIECSLAFHCPEKLGSLAGEFIEWSACLWEDRDEALII